MANTKPNLFVFYLFWIIATTIGWLAGIFNLSSSAKTYMDILRVLPVYLADGLLIGLVAGIGQALALRRFTDLTRSWVWATALGYGLAFAIGLIVSVSLPSFFTLLRGEYPFILPFSESSTVSMRLHMDDLFWGGILIGAIQWPVLRKIIPSPNRSKAILWTLATWFALGLDIFVRAFTQRTFLAEYPMGITGTVIGLFTGLVLVALLSNSEKPGH